MKKLTFLFVALTIVLLAGCSKGYDPEKCEEMLDKPMAELTTSDVEFMLDQCEILFDKMNFGESEEQDAFATAKTPEGQMLGNLIMKFTGYAINLQMKGEQMPESVQKKFDKISQKCQDALEY